MQENDWMDVKAAAKEFKVSPMTIWRLVWTGRVGSRKREAGRPRVYVDRRDLRKLFEPKPTRKRR